MKNSRLGVAALAAIAAALLLTACPDNKPAASSSAPSETSAPATEASAPAAAPEASAPAATPSEASAPAAEASAPATTASAMPAECEEYFAKVKACVGKMGASAAAFKQAMDTSEEQWSKVADKSTLAPACKAAAEQFATTAKAMGC